MEQNNGGKESWGEKEWLDFLVVLGEAYIIAVMMANGNVFGTAVATGLYVGTDKGRTKKVIQSMGIKIK